MYVSFGNVLVSKLRFLICSNEYILVKWLYDEIQLFYAFYFTIQRNHTLNIKKRIHNNNFQNREVLKANEK